MDVGRRGKYFNWGQLQKNPQNILSLYFFYLKIYTRLDINIYVIRVAFH